MVIMPGFVKRLPVDDLQQRLMYWALVALIYWNTLVEILKQLVFPRRY